MEETSSMATTENEIGTVTPSPDLSRNETTPLRIKISETIISILNHYKQPDPLGLPGLPVPDPMPIPDMKRSFSIGTMFFTDIQLHGLSKYRVEHIVSTISTMTVEVTLCIDVLNVTGNYTLQTWISTASGPFVVKVENVTVQIATSLEVRENGTLETQDLETDLIFGDIDMDFQSLGLVSRMFQGIMNSVGTFLFDSIKPYILREVNTNIKHEINDEIKKINKVFLATTSPVDQLIYEIKKSLRFRGYEPFCVPEYTTSLSVFKVRFSHTWLFGPTNFFRTKDVIFEMKDKTLHISFEVSTKKIVGKSNWEIILIPGSLYKAGVLLFTVGYVKVRIEASQSMNITHPPMLDDIQLEVGDIHVKFQNLGSLDTLVDIGGNVIPNIIKQQILDAIERPIKFKIQEALNRVNVEQLVVENADQLDKELF